MKHYTLLVIGTVLVMIAAVMLATGAYEESKQDRQLVDEMTTRSLLEAIDGRMMQKPDIDQPELEDLRYYFNTYSELNLIFSDERMDSVLNIKYDITGHGPRDLQLFQAEMEAGPERSTTNGEDELKEINIPHGNNAAQISSKLVAAGLIKDYDNFLKLLVKLGIDRKLKAGEFRFDSEDTAVEVLLSLTAK